MHSILGLVSISLSVLLGLCIYRIWLTKMGLKVKRYCLRSNYCNYLLGLLAGYCAAEPLYRLIMGISVLNLDGQDRFAAFEVVSLIIEALTWRSMLVMIVVETKIYIREFRWFVRFGVVYVLVGNAVMLNLILSLRYFYTRSVLYIYFSTLLVKLFFGVLLLVHIPHLDPYHEYIPIWNESLDYTEYEALREGHHVCPERHASIFSRITYGWVTPLMQQGYRRPLTEKDVWKLDTWDQT